MVWMARGGVRGQAHRMTHRQLAAGSVDGYLDPVLAPAVSYFGRLLNPASRGGGALAVRLKGQTMVDVWAGFADRRRSRPWERDTVTICFSTTNPLVSLVALGQRCGMTARLDRGSDVR